MLECLALHVSVLTSRDISLKDLEMDKIFQEKKKREEKRKREEERERRGEKVDLMERTNERTNERTYKIHLWLLRYFFYSFTSSSISISILFFRFFFLLSEGISFNSVTTNK